MFKCLIPALLAVVLSGAACTKKNSGSLDYGLEVKDTFRFNLLTEPPTIDWSKGTDYTAFTIQFNIMDGLTDYNLSDPELALVPSLALKWAPSENARVWTFVLRKGVKWSDGVAFTGQQVIDSWERTLNPKTSSAYAYTLYPVKNAREYNAGKLKDFTKVGLHLNAAGDLVVELEQPMSYFPLLTTLPATYPVRKDLIDKFGDRWTEPANLQTLGAYKLKVWEHDKAIVLERNDTYWGEKAKVRHVLGYMIAEFSTALSLMDAGRLDFQMELPAKELPALRHLPTYHQQEELLNYYYGFNTRHKPLNDVNVRRAFLAAVDRKQITDLLAAGHTPLTSWIPKGMFGYEPERGQKFDPQLANKLLDEAGYKDRKTFPILTLAFNTNENHQRIAENVQAQVKKNLGVQLQLGNEEWKTYLAHLRTDPPDIYRMGWVADYPDPSTYMDQLVSGSDNNYTGWRSKKYDALNIEGSRALDPRRRREIYSQMQKILTEEDIPVLPVYSGSRPVLLNSRVKNFPLNSIMRYPFRGVTLQ